MSELAGELAPLLLTTQEGAAMEAHGETEAAVLVPLYRAGDGAIRAIFTRRREDLRRHAGEISFPGGRRDEGEELLDTALREADEEIGLEPASVAVAGALPPVGTFVTGYRVHPFVGAIECPAQWRPAEAEVAAVLDFSLAELVAGYGKRRLVRRGIPLRMDTYVVDDQLIWGATARMLAELLSRLSPLI